MTVKVLWKTYEKDTIARGYWDQGILEDLFAGRWRVPGWRTFEHYEDDFNHIKNNEGAVVVIPARHNAQHIQKLNADLRRLGWVLLILTGDEESVFDWEAVKHPNMQKWLMSPKPGVHPQDNGMQYLGSGYPPQAREWLKKVGHVERDLTFFFSGQNTHSRRSDAVAALRNVPGGILNTTEGFTQGMDHEAYYRNMARSKLCPAPSGPLSVDSFRLYEALEAGSIPVADARTPKEEMSEHWSMVFGGPPQFPVISDWGNFEDELALVNRYPGLWNQVGSWWELKKRDLALRLKSDLDLCGAPKDEPKVADDLSVVVVTSPVLDHPDTFILDETIDSIRSREDMAGVEIFVLCDGVRIEQEHYRERYEQYVDAVLWKARNEWTNVYPVVFEEHMHQAKMTLEVIRRGIIKTPLMMFVEHDTPLINEIPFRECCNFVLDGNTDMLRFHHEAVVPEPHWHLFPEGKEPTLWNGIPFIRTTQWSQRPHIVKVDFYQRILEENFSHNSRTMIEDTMHGIAQNPDWYGKIHIYYPPDDCKRSTHSDGRRGDPKYGMVP